MKIDCTASAASSTPNTRTITFRAVMPDQLMDLLGDEEQASSVTAITARMAATTAPSSLRSPLVPAASTMALVMAPGPASSGVASGNTAISAWRSALLSASSLSLADSVVGRGALGERHLERDDEQNDAAGGLQRGERHAELAQDRPAEQGEGEHDQRWR